MSRSSLARRGRAEFEAWRADCDRDADERDERDEFAAENASLRERVEEVEGWYRLLQADHARLQDQSRRNGLRTTELQREVNRLEEENEQFRALADRRGGPGTQAEEAPMSRFQQSIQVIRRNK